MYVFRYARRLARSLVGLVIGVSVSSLGDIPAPFSPDAGCVNENFQIRIQKLHRRYKEAESFFLTGHGLDIVQDSLQFARVRFRTGVVKCCGAFAHGVDSDGHVLFL